MRKVGAFLALMGFYVLLSGQIHNTFLMVCGAVACAGITALSVRLGILDEEGMPWEHWPRTALYTPWLIWQVLLANWDVAKRIWSPALPIEPHVVEVPHSLETSFGLATYINSITLTPGTVTISSENGTLLVHALTQAAADDLRSGGMHEKVARVEGSAGKASKGA